MVLNNIENTIVKRIQVSEFMRGQVIGFFMCKKSYAQISDELDIPISTIGHVMKAYNTQGVEVPPKRAGRPKVCIKRTNLGYLLNSTY